MARAYRLTLEPEDIETREVYYIEGDNFDDEHPLTVNDGDAFDPVLCDNDGYYVADIMPCSIEEAKKHNPYEV